MIQTTHLQVSAASSQHDLKARHDDVAAQVTQAATGAAADVAASEQVARSGELASALTSFSDALHASPVDVKFSIDAETNRVVTRVVDRENGDVIRQFPSEEVLRISQALEKLQGLLMHQTA